MGSNKSIFDGETFLGNEALEMGLIDGVGNVYDVMREEFGENIDVSEIPYLDSWNNILTKMYSLQVSDFHSVKYSVLSSMFSGNNK